jgi:chromosomal replication initiation ATPase DnaA
MLKILPRYVVEATVRVTGISLEQLKGTTRKRQITRARNVLYRVTPELGLTLSSMGRHIGRDHSTMSKLIRHKPETPAEREIIEAVKIAALEVTKEKHQKLCQDLGQGVSA